MVVFGGPLTLTELAAAEQVRPPTMTRIIAALEREGLVSREPDASDRRITRVRATARGARVLEAGRRRRVDALARALAELSAAERETLTQATGLLETLVGFRHGPARGSGSSKART